MDKYQAKARYKALYLDGCKRVYTISMKICSPRLMTRLEGTSGFTVVKEAEDIVSLVVLIQKIYYRLDDQYELHQPEGQLWGILGGS